MTDLAITVAIGRGYANTGEPTHVDVLGSLYIGSSGRWTFQPVRRSRADAEPPLRVSLVSERNLMQEIRAGAALSLGLGMARQLAETALGPDWAKSRAALGPADLVSIGEESRGKGISMLITALDAGLLREMEPSVDALGWSTILCGVQHAHLESQWNSPAK
jgi:hypothetical protein